MMDGVLGSLPWLEYVCVCILIYFDDILSKKEQHVCDE